MSSIETKQVSLRLTDLAYVLNVLKKKKRLVLDANGDEAFKIQFDSNTFSFTKGKVITVGANVAEALQRDAFVIVGDDLTGEVTPVLEEVESFDISTSRAQKFSKTTCPICHEDQLSVRGLLKHIADDHDEDVEDEDEDEKEKGFVVDVKRAGKIPVPPQAQLQRERESARDRRPVNQTSLLKNTPPTDTSDASKSTEDSDLGNENEAAK